jgi:hypothetical protein
MENMSDKQTHITQSVSKEMNEIFQDSTNAILITKNYVL